LQGFCINTGVKQQICPYQGFFSRVIEKYLLAIPGRGNINVNSEQQQNCGTYAGE